MRGCRTAWVFWDFNGTLIDDRDYAIGVRNRVFPHFGLPTVKSVEEYYHQFTFPIRVYYERAGVTDENFVEVAHAWMDEYMRAYDTIPLRGDALLALQAFRQAGIRQAVLSASKRDILQEQLAHYGVQEYFEATLGLSHIYATSKQALGQAFLQENEMEPSQCVLLGDTLHDAEVAAAMGVRCILVMHGHQSESTLREAGVPVVNSLTDAAKLVLE